MARKEDAPLLELTLEERDTLTALSRSRTAPAGYVERARILLYYADGIPITEIARVINTDRSKIYRCIQKACELGPTASLEDAAGRGRKPQITAEARAWVVSLACQKPVDLGYPHEVWTIQLLVEHARKHCRKTGHPSLGQVGRATIHAMLSEAEIKPHKISYYLERRDPDFDTKMNDVLCVYQEVAMIKEKGIPDSEPAIAILSYDEKPGIQAIGTTAPDLPPVPGKHVSIGRDHEYVRHGTLSLLAGIDLVTGHVHGVVAEKHRSREFIHFLKHVHRSYPKGTKIRIILDNHSAHTSKETQAFLATLPERFEFTFTPKHGSWLNLIEVFFSKMTRTFLRHIRVHSKAELTDRLIQYLDQLNDDPVTFNWKYGLNDSLT